MKKVLVECYDSLYVYLMGDSRKNELYMAKHIDYFGNQVSHEVTEWAACGVRVLSLDVAAWFIYFPEIQFLF